jgi:4-alpha-glucanotransferase
MMSSTNLEPNSISSHADSQDASRNFVSEDFFADFRNLSPLSDVQDGKVEANSDTFAVCKNLNPMNAKIDNDDDDHHHKQQDDNNLNFFAEFETLDEISTKPPLEEIYKILIKHSNNCSGIPGGTHIVNIILSSERANYVSNSKHQGRQFMES